MAIHGWTARSGSVLRMLWHRWPQLAKPVVLLTMGDQLLPPMPLAGYASRSKFKCPPSGLWESALRIRIITDYLVRVFGRHYGPRGIRKVGYLDSERFAPTENSLRRMHSAESEAVTQP